MGSEGSPCQLQMKNCFRRLMLGSAGSRPLSHPQALSLLYSILAKLQQCFWPCPDLFPVSWPTRSSLYVLKRLLLLVPADMTSTDTFPSISSAIASESIALSRHPSFRAPRGRNDRPSCDHAVLDRGGAGDDAIPTASAQLSICLRATCDHLLH